MKDASARSIFKNSIFGRDLANGKVPAVNELIFNLHPLVVVSNMWAYLISFSYLFFRL